MVHGAEVVFVELVDVRQVERVDLEQGHLEAAFGQTENFGAGGGVIGGRTDEVENAGTIGFEEVVAAMLLIGVEPEILGQQAQVACVVESCGHKVIVHAALDVFHAVFEVEVVGEQEVLLDPEVKLVGIAVGVNGLGIGREDGRAELLFRARGQGEAESDGQKEFI